MKIRRTLQTFGIVLGFGVIILIVYLWAVPRLSHTSRLQDEQEIYSMMLDSTYISGNMVWGEQTDLREMELSPENMQYIESIAPYLESSTLEDLQSSNSHSYLLKDYLPANENFVFLSNSDIELFFSDWQVFSHEHPDINGFTSISRIGFNSSYTQAIVLRSGYGRTFGSPFEYGGDGILLTFKKLGIRWVIQDELLVWIMG